MPRKDSGNEFNLPGVFTSDLEIVRIGKYFVGVVVVQALNNSMQQNCEATKVRLDQASALFNLPPF